MATFLGRNKQKAKRDKAVSVDISGYADNPEKMKQKFIEKYKSTWAECDFLYSVRAWRPQKQSNSSSRSTEVGTDAILTLFHLPEEGRVVLCPFECSTTVELGQHHFLEDINQIKCDEGAMECAFYFIATEAPQMWRIAQHIDRDEFVWVLSELSKSITGLSITVVGYTPDIDLVARGYENKYPALLSLLESSVASTTQAEGEKEAELLLEQLDWSLPVPVLQSQLHDDILTLNVEICDLLLQWEGDENCLDDANLSSNHIRETVELLTTLNHVDKELGFVGDWLGNQIEHLSEVQKEIKQIESESGTLETSLQNLTSVKSLISSITESLQLGKFEQDILLKAEKSLKQLLVGFYMGYAHFFYSL